MNKYFRFIINKQFRFEILAAKGFYNKMSDQKFLEKKYYMKFGKKLELHNPQTFNEKLQWLKLYDRNQLYTTLVDKYAVREYIKEKIGEEYLIPLVGGPWKSFDEIDFNMLPNQFVLKCTHDSGGLIICKDKSKLDIKTARKKINKCLRNNYYWGNREWPYKNVPPQIIAEKYMTDGNNNFLPVYKFFCFNGEPKIIQTIQNDKQPNESIDYFSIDWKLLKLRQNFPNSEKPFERPEQLSAMVEIARVLSKGKSFVRVDLYIINNEVKFSEHTFYSDSGTEKFKPENWDTKLGEWIKLSEETGGGDGVILNKLVYGVRITEKQKQEILFNSNGDVVEINEPLTISDLTDYKFFSFNGTTKAMFIATDRASTTEETKFDFFDMEFNHLPFTNGHPNADKMPICPSTFTHMKELAGRLSKGIPQARIDFYDIDGKVYFGEITLFHWSGMVPFEPDEWDKTFGDWIELKRYNGVER